MDYLRTLYNLGLAFLVILSIVGHSLSLECFKCTNLLDERCGINWEFEESAGDKYKINCGSQATACIKIVGEIQGSGAQHVYRDCWDMTTQEPYTPTGCEKDEIRGGALCRCKGNFCNGQRPLAASGAVLVATFICAQITSIY